MDAKAPIAVIVLTSNEERNLAACLGSVADWVEQIFVVDSGSTDRTVQIAGQCGAAVVVHPFESHARQWRWALETLPVRARWVLCLDADQRITPELKASIVAALLATSDPGTIGFFLNRRQIFRGRWIRHGGYYPKYLLKMFCRDAATVDEGDLVDHHFHVAGPTGRLDGDLIEDNQNEASIAEWIAKHNRYARLQATEEIARMDRGVTGGRLLGNPDQRTARLKVFWWKLPLYVRPFLYFTYRYVFRLGFLDGKEGLIFHFMQALWYRLLVDINRDELSAKRSPEGVAGKSAERTSAG